MWVSDSEPAVAAQGLVKRFRWLTAVDGLSLEVKRGEVFGLLGPNGAGKTTTVRMICTLIPPSSGTVTVLGRDVQGDPIGVRSCIGLLPETPSLYESLSAEENLRFYCEMYGVSKAESSQRIDELLGIFGLSARRAFKVKTFSKGMKQKLALARALVHDPPVVFLDEPTAGLDPESAKMVRDNIAEMSRGAGKTIFLCTHNLVEAESLCSRVAIIKSGKIIRIGSPRELGGEGGEAVTYVLVLRRVETALVEALRGLDYVRGAEARDGSVEVRIESPSDNAPRLVEAVLNNGGEIVEFRREARTLEDVYLEAVRP